MTPHGTSQLVQQTCKVMQCCYMNKPASNIIIIISLLALLIIISPLNNNNTTIQRKAYKNQVNEKRNNKKPSSSSSWSLCTSCGVLVSSSLVCRCDSMAVRFMSIFYLFHFTYRNKNKSLSATEEEDV